MISTILIWSERLLALATLLQAWELLQLKSAWSDAGVWQWNTIRKQYANLPKWIVTVLDRTLNADAYAILLRASIASSILIWFLPAAFHLLFLLIVFAATWLTSIRWRGLFNGGSDSMTVTIALSLLLARLVAGYPDLIKVPLLFIAVQVTASYTIAGFAKLRNREWRDGSALSVFFETPRYDSPPEVVKNIFKNSKAAIALSMAIIIFECSFPLAWIHPQICAVYLALAFAFHLLNFWIFGLNRFVFAWAAGYPALYLASTLLFNS